jgi:putative tryptophan/tyrosine transport system substrate-binding protein
MPRCLQCDRSIDAVTEPFSAAHIRSAETADRSRTFGYVEGQNLKLEVRDAGNRVETLPDLAAGLEKDGVDIIVAVGITAAAPAKASAHRTPIVFITNDSVGRGLARSLARPGGNLTGIEMMVVDFGSKWVEFLHELVPHASRFIAVAEARANTQQIKTVQDAVGKAGGADGRPNRANRCAG